MLHRAQKSALWAVAKNVTKSDRVLPRVCGTIFFSVSDDLSASDKNDRFWRAGIDQGFLSETRVRFLPVSAKHSTRSFSCWKNETMDMTEKTDQQIQNLIDNHRRAGKLDAPLAVAAIEEQARRNTSFDFKAGIEFLLQAARAGRAVNYRQLAEAGGVLKPDDTWYQHMARKIPLSQIVDYAHTHDMPAITALVETTQGVTDSILAGFQKGLDDTGIRVPVGMTIEEYYHSERQRAFDWAATK